MDDWIASGVYEAQRAAHQARVGRSNAERWKGPARLPRSPRHSVRRVLAGVLIALAGRLVPAAGDGRASHPSAAGTRMSGIAPVGERGEHLAPQRHLEAAA